MLKFLKDTWLKVNQSLDRPLYYPWLMTRKEKKIFDELIKSSKYYLEFGMGGSTLRALLNSKAKVHTVESSMDWIKFMQRYKVIKKEENRRLFIYHVNIGPTSELGYPISKEFKKFFPNYSSFVFKKLNSEKLDLVLIDGRFRVACTLQVILNCYNNSNLIILFHDFWKRKKYYSVLNFLDVIEKVDTLGVFSIKKSIDLNVVQKEYEVYKFDPA